MSAEYDFDKRLEEWKERFATAWEIETSKIQFHVEQKDPCWIPLENAEYKMEQIRKDVQKYNSQHKTQEYVALTETITDLMVEMDRIDVEFSPERQKKRRELYAKLEEIRTELLGRGGKCKNTSCRECGKVKTMSK